MNLKIFLFRLIQSTSLLALNILCPFVIYGASTPVNLNCGIYAVALLGQLLGMPFQYQVLVSSVPHHQNGLVSINDVVTVAEQNGLELLPVKGDFNQLLNVETPVIIGIEDNHLGVLTSINNENATLIDQSGTEKNIFIEELKREWSGQVLIPTKITTDHSSSSVLFINQIADFDSFESGTILKYTFVGTNFNENAITLSLEDKSCGCTAVNIEKSIVAPAEQCFISVKIDTLNKHSGLMNENFSIRWETVDGLKNGLEHFQITGNIEQNIQLEASSMNILLYDKQIIEGSLQNQVLFDDNSLQSHEWKVESIDCLGDCFFDVNFNDNLFSINNPEEFPIGLYQSQLKINLVQDENTINVKQFTVPVQVHNSGPISFEPLILNYGLLSEGSTTEKTIVIRDKLKRNISVASVDEPLLLVEQEMISKDEIILKVKIDKHLTSKIFDERVSIHLLCGTEEVDLSLRIKGFFIN